MLRIPREPFGLRFASPRRGPEPWLPVVICPSWRQRTYRLGYRTANIPHLV